MKRNLGGPAFVLAVIALFVALGEGAVAAGIVPLARHALTAGTAANALKLGGKTPTQVKSALRGAQGPAGEQGPQGPQGPAGPSGSTAISVHPQTFTLNASGTAGDTALITASCSSGQKAVGGGYAPNGTQGLASGVIGSTSKPTSADDGWSVFVENIDGSASHTGTVYAVCLG